MNTSAEGTMKNIILNGLQTRFFEFLWRKRLEALLGVQLVLTLIMVSFMQKLGHHFSIAKWLLCSTGLIRYLYPTDDELKSLSGIQRNTKGNKKNRYAVQGEKNKDTFYVLRSLDIKLETTKITHLDIVHLRFYAEYQWLLDFSAFAALIYFLTEAYQLFFKNKEEFNLSMLWCFLVVGFSLKMLISLTQQYFEKEDSGERSTVIVTGFVYFLLAMIILIVDENNLELGLETAYQNFNQNAIAFLEKQGIASSGPASKIILKFFLAVWCGMIGGLFTFPGLRMARMHWDALKRNIVNVFEFLEKLGILSLIPFLVNNKITFTSFAMPFLLTTLWIKPLFRDYLTVRIFQGMSEPLMSASSFESLRLLAVIIAVAIRFGFMPLYLQCYLNMAHSRVEDMKCEAGRITNIDLQKRIAAVFYYLCVVALQYTAPILMCLFLTFMYKTLGGFTWTGVLLEAENECPLMSMATLKHLHNDITSDENFNVKESAHQFSLALESLKQVFTAEVFRGLFGLTTWWTCFAWFATSSVGMVYQSYFSHI